MTNNKTKNKDAQYISHTTKRGHFPTLLCDMPTLSRKVFVCFFVCFCCSPFPKMFAREPVERQGCGRTSCNVFIIVYFQKTTGSYF